VYTKPQPKDQEEHTFKLAFRNQQSMVTKYFEESDNGKELKPKFENLEVFYKQDDTYNITRIRICYEYDDIVSDIKKQLHEDQKEAESLGDTMRINLCQESIDHLDIICDEMKNEIEYIHQQRAPNEDSSGQNQQSANVNENSDSIPDKPYIKPGVYRYLAETQKREELETKVKNAVGNYYFFQLDDETNCFLHPLCMKILLTEYGSYENLPLDITSKILEIEEFNMNDLNRRKYRAISHLPKAAEFKFIEVDLSSMVSYKTFELFEKQIRNREKIRQKKVEQEKKYNDKAKLIEERKYECFLRTNL
jgi:hypothetical protein